METKTSIADYLKKGYEGPFFYRMVETVLSRDKNWVRWKIESCPSIEKPAISAEEHIAAKNAARKATANKRLRANPLQSIDLDFLTEADPLKGMEQLKETSRYSMPSVNSFKDKIAIDDLEIDLPTNDETKEAAINSKASKSWRALRIASKTKLAVFDKIDDPEDINIIFREDALDGDSVKDGLAVVAEVNAEEQGVAKVEDTTTSDDAADFPVAENVAAPAEAHKPTDIN